MLDKKEQPSAWEQITGGRTPHKIDQLNAPPESFRKPVIVTRECTICGTQEVRRV